MHWPTAGSGSSPATPLQPLSSWRPRTSRRTAWPRPSQLVEADLLAPAGESLPRPDVVTANLPYVSSAEVDERRGSLGFEPRIALDGGPDGLDLLRRFLADVPLHAAPGATLVLELGVDQVAAVTR